jgi:hypothetical protein
MKCNLEPEDLQIIVSGIIEGLKPYLAGMRSSEDRVFDKKGLSEYLRVDVSWIDRNVYAVPHFYVGKYVRFKQSRIDKWIEANTKTPSSNLRLVR